MSNRDDNSGERPKLRLVNDDEDIEETGGIGSEPDEDDIRVDIISADEDEPEEDQEIPDEADAEEPYEDGDEPEDPEEYGEDDPEDPEGDDLSEQDPEEYDESDEEFGDDEPDEDDPEDDPDLLQYKKRLSKLKSRRIQKVLDIVLYSILGLDLVLAIVFVLGFTGVIKFKNTSEAITSDDMIAAMKDDDSGAQEEKQQKPKKEKKDKEEITFTISATGDCTFGNAQVHTYENSFCEYYDKYGADYFMQNVKDTFSADNMTLVNLECVLTNSDSMESKDFNLRGYPEYTAIMTGSSIEAVSLGNNHTYDYGEAGLNDTMNALKEAGIGYAYKNTVATFKTSAGILIGVVSAGLQSQTIEAEQFIYDGIEKLKSDKVDLIIACVHWGVEKDYYANDYQVEVGHMIIDAGADLVIGNHPHVLQGVEIYNGKIICYSLGNFCFGGNKNPSDKDSAIFQQTFHFDKDKKLKSKIDAQFIPISISGSDDYNDFCPVLLKKNSDRYAQVISNLNDYCAPISDTMVGNRGKIKLSTEPG
ncbi:MAG: CapA family protein [Lachnospiraceae bacterium]|nr:CapA family protein [Lachnospiraceae bacterium]